MGFMLTKLTWGNPNPNQNTMNVLQCDMGSQLLSILCKIITRNLNDDLM